MSLEEKEQECSRLFRTTIFIDNDKSDKEISGIKNQFNDKSLHYDIETKKILVSNYLIDSYKCFSSDNYSFSFSLNYKHINDENSYYSFFAYYTEKFGKKTSSVFALIQRNPILLETNVEKMENDLYKKVKDKNMYDDKGTNPLKCK